MLERAVVVDVLKKPVVWPTGDVVPCQWFSLSKVDFIFSWIFLMMKWGPPQIPLQRRMKLGIMMSKTWVMWQMNVTPVQLKLKRLCELIPCVVPLVSMALLFVHPSLHANSGLLSLSCMYIFNVDLSRRLDIVDKGCDIATVSSTISETQTQFLRFIMGVLRLKAVVWDSKQVFIRIKIGTSEAQNQYFWDSNTVFLRFIMGIPRLKHSIFEIQNVHSETQTRCLWDSKQIFMKLKNGYYETQNWYYETQNGYFWNSKWVVLRLKTGIMRLKTGISETQNG